MWAPGLQLHRDHTSSPYEPLRPGRAQRTGRGFGLSPWIGRVDGHERVDARYRMCAIRLRHSQTMVLVEEDTLNFVKSFGNVESRGCFAANLGVSLAKHLRVRFGAESPYDKSLPKNKTEHNLKPHQDKVVNDAEPNSGCQGQVYMNLLPMFRETTSSLTG
jgi:hypothetical protein